MTGVFGRAARRARTRTVRPLVGLLAAAPLLLASSIPPAGAVFHDTAYANTEYAVVSTPQKLRIAGTIDAEYGTTPTGSVTLSHDGTQLATMKLGPRGTYAFTFDADEEWGDGDIAFELTYTGDTNHLPSTTPVTVTLGSP